MFSGLQLLEHCRAGYEVVLESSLVPLSPGPVHHRHYLGLSPLIVVETGYRGLYVNRLSHKHFPRVCCSPLAALSSYCFALHTSRRTVARSSKIAPTALYLAVVICPQSSAMHRPLSFRFPCPYPFAKIMSAIRSPAWPSHRGNGTYLRPKTFWLRRLRRTGWGTVSNKT
jgi:hypothetical protein